MQTCFIGDLVKKRRKELKLTQEQLCTGVCEPITISRLENGRQTPSMNVLNALLQRLDLPEHKYFALLNADELKIAQLKEEIVSCNTLKDSARGLDAINKLEKIVSQSDPLTRQFILRSKVSLGKEENGQIVPYPFEEKLDMLLEAIHLTSPRFDIDEITRGLYSLDEVKVINQIALIYSRNGEHKKAIDIYYQLLKYIKKHFQNILQSGGLLPLVAFNYARELDLVGRYAEAIEIAESGWQSCVQYGQYHTLPSTIAIIAECYHFLNQDEKSKNFYRQAFYLCQAINDKECLNAVLSETRKYFGDDFSF